MNRAVVASRVALHASQLASIATLPSRSPSYSERHTSNETDSMTTQLSPRESHFVDKYARYFDARRIRTIVDSGKFICEAAADGAYLRDVNGKQYLDCFLATGVFNLGHRNPEIERVLQQALKEESFGGVFYLSEAKARLSRDLVECSPPGLDVALPAVGGGEAMDLAIKLAAGATGRRRVVCAERSYHGSAGVSAELGPEALRSWYPLNALAVTRVEPGDIDALRSALDETVAAVVLEPIRSLVDGRKADAMYWRQVREACDAVGAKLIIDEVVCGMGRLGAVWGSELFDIRPDVLVTAKGLSGGFFPMAALVLRSNLLDGWSGNAFRSYSTYAWSNVGARVASAALAETARLLPQAMSVGDQLTVALQQVKQEFPGTIREVQRTGLHFVLNLHEGAVTGQKLTLKALANGLLLQASGAYPDAPAKLMPPLILQAAHVDEICQKLVQSLRELRAE